MYSKRSSLSVLLFSALSLALVGCNSTSKTPKTDHNSTKKLPALPRAISLSDTNGYDIRQSTPFHPSSYITQMCYTKTTDDANNTYNPCFACHTVNRAPNYTMGDTDLQESYDFPAPALKNPYTNNFIDFSKRVAAIDDESIIKYVDKSNYFDENKSIILQTQLENLSPLWDSDGDGKWSGYIPDCYYNFDAHGLDRDENNHATGWAAFGYMPFLGTFWPTNGSTDDVLIRLDDSFRKMSAGGDFNSSIYLLNLAIVESLVKQKNVPIAPIDEALVGVDLNKNSIVDTATEVVFDWDPNNGKNMSYVGYAKTLQEEGKIHLAAGLYPENTEFLHSVRYIKSDKDGEIAIAPRMKELRYAKKTLWLTYANLLNKGLADVQEADLNPDRLETFRGNMEHGLGNNMGWVYQGFIEDKNGNLRPQSYEETLNCMGCHSNIGVTTDSTFAFPRKLDNNFQHGWYHATQKDLRGIAEFHDVNGTWELEKYLELNPYSDEFRENSEAYNKFHTPSGDLNQTMLQNLRKDVTLLLYPSHTRALTLDKAYKALVEQQKFYNGKAGHVKPMKNVYKKVKDGQSTELKAEK